MKNGFIGGLSLILIIIVALIVTMICTVKVPAGYVAVQYNMNGGIKDEVLSQGWHLVSPTTHTTLYTVGIEQSYLTAGKNGDSKDDESFEASTSEGKGITVELTFTYQYDPANVTKVFTTFKGQSGTDVRDGFIKPNIISWTKEVIARYKVADIIGAERANVNIALTDYLSKKFEPYGIRVSNVSMVNIDVDAETSQAINNKITAQQNAETQAINNQTAIDKAKADATAKVTAAEADANATLIRAKAEAEANELLKKSINEQILDSEWISKWDGKMPSVVGNGSGMTYMIK